MSKSRVGWVREADRWSRWRGPTVRASRSLVVVLCGALFVSVSSAVAGATIPAGSVAVVVGKPITVRTFDHWMYVAAKGQAADSSSAPLIVPTDPPDFKGCIAQVRRQIPSLKDVSDQVLRRDCRQLFTSMSSQVLDFLITANWFEDQAAAEHVVISATDVRNALEKAKRQEFRSAGAFRKFLKETGQTEHDLLFRMRVNLTYTALIGHVSGLRATIKAQNKLNALVRRRYQSETTCSPYYVMNDCEHDPGRARPLGLDPS